MLQVNVLSVAVLWVVPYGTNFICYLCGVVLEQSAQNGDLETKINLFSANFFPPMFLSLSPRELPFCLYVFITPTAAQFLRSWLLVHLPPPRLL